MAVHAIMLVPELPGGATLLLTPYLYLVGVNAPVCAHSPGGGYDLTSWALEGHDAEMGQWVDLSVRVVFVHVRVQCEDAEKCVTCSPLSALFLC